MPTLTKTNAGLNFLRSGNSGASSPIVTYFAVGSGTSSPTAGQTTLDSEQFRKAVTSYTNGTTGELLVDVYLSPTDAVGVNIQEVAVFGGGSPTPNSGTMLGRALYTPSTNPKTNTVSIQLHLDLTYS